MSYNYSGGEGSMSMLRGDTPILMGSAALLGIGCMVALTNGMDPLTKLINSKSGPLASSLTFLGLALAWMGAFVIVCVRNGAAPQMTESDVPSRLFAMGGVFGMQRPAVEVVWRTLCAGLMGVAFLGVCDLLYARHTKARWFALHVIANGWIALLCLPDMWFIISNPIEALRASTTNHWPTAMVFSVHLYHMVFFSNLYFIDWLHHILMVVLGAPLLITGQVGPLMNYNNFWMCGVPGGIDYAMLYAVKHGWMSPLEEKNINKSINVWFRAPALICSSCLAYLQMFVQEGVPTWVKGVRVFLIILAAWNGLFFMERVVGNYHVCAYKARKEKKDEAASDDKPPEPPSDYETEAHFTPGGAIPGYVSKGLREVISTDDLQVLLKNKDLHLKKGE